MDSGNDYRYGTGDTGDLSRHDRTSSFGWNIFLFAVAITMIAVNWGFLRPASKQLEEMKQQVSSLEQTVQLLTRQQGSAREATNLLQLLSEQGKHTTNAAEGLAEIQRLHSQLISQAKQLKTANMAIDRLGDLRKKVSEHSLLIDDAVLALSESNQVQEDLIDAAATTHDADEALDRLATLRMRLLRSIGYLEEAAPIVEEVDHLTERLKGSSELAADASTVADQLLDLHQTLINEADRASEAELALNELVDIRTLLDAQSIDIVKTKDTLHDLVEMKDDVLAQNANIADAIETLERTVDLTDQYQQASKSFETMRRWLTDVILMEPTVQRAMQTLEPISELGNLRRISQAELRHAAQVVRDMRRTEIARRSYTVRSTPEIASVDELERE
ncbi:MAG: hypothetical protein P8N76_21185 [Pirellulaceae bacterium]|nr:hypothetical protein [Pirellulaceae bacterium]